MKGSLNWLSWTQLSLLLIASCSFSEAALALPGQSVSTVVQWSQNHPILPKLKREIAELSGQPYYISETKIDAGTVVLNVSPADNNDTKVAEETIAFRTPQPATVFDFNRTNTKGLSLVERIYSRAIANDFRTSKYVARVEYPNRDLRFYQGRLFSYVTIRFKDASEPGEHFYHFTMMPLKGLATEVSNEQVCYQQNPESGCGD